MSLDPVLQQILDQIPLPSGDLDWGKLRAESASLIALLNGPEGPVVVADVQTLEIDGKGGPVPLRIIRPETEPRGTLHFVHGGAWALGSVDHIEGVVRRLAKELSMVVVASGYRLAPEAPFPAGFEDVMTAAAWVLDHAAELGGSTLPVAIGGESAGANLAAAAAIALRGGDHPRFDAQLLFFPAVDLRDGANSLPSRRADADPTLPATTFPQIFSTYCGENDRGDPRISPMAAESLADLPPVLLVVLSVDPLRDEAVAYAERLKSSGVPVDVMEFDNLTHGFLGFAGLVPAAAAAVSDIADRFSMMLARLPHQTK
ncbi:MAG: alpha/beta hydrolase [Phenylobacterium sp.]|uniref:alpha/beta hydrolase n=1 Tax=Phenylobacterium sp. TaxID=1871053 RepID=UPI002734F799|nr:alpha/beta hydrolase [Phenylobacterium sp.]MDP3748638.1 alpha/beta hydrolase [Phenylobacterium sp.]